MTRKQKIKQDLDKITTRSEPRNAMPQGQGVLTTWVTFSLTDTQLDELVTYIESLIKQEIKKQMTKLIKRPICSPKTITRTIKL